MNWQRHQVSAAVVFFIAAGISMIVTDCLILLTFTSYTATAIRVIQFGFLLSVGLASIGLLLLIVEAIRNRRRQDPWKRQP